MEMKRSQHGAVAVLEINGKVRVGESAQQFAAELQRVLSETSGPVLLDVSGIDYIDSTGIGELVGHMQRLSHEGRQMGLLQPHKRLKSLLELTGLDQYFTVFSDLSEGLKALQGK
jgi:anti-sigma B factor antagonist